MKFKPARNHFLVTVRRIDSSEGGIVLPETARQNAEIGKVVALGPTSWLAGVEAPQDLEIGDYVMFSVPPRVVEIDGKHYGLLTYQQYIGKVPNEKYAKWVVLSA